MVSFLVPFFEKKGTEKSFAENFVFLSA